VITAAATASVTVQAAPSPPPPAPAASAHRRTAAALAVFGVKQVRLGAATPRLALTVAAPDRTTIVLALFDGKGRKLAGWVKRAEAGTHRIILVLPPKARKPGRDRLRVRATGGVAKTLPVRILSS
jgi:hypothetical protein